MRAGRLSGVFVVVLAAASSQAFAQGSPGRRYVEPTRVEIADRVVTIFYDLAGGATTIEVSVEASLDNGATFSIRPVSVSGDVGPDVKPGTGKKIVWRASDDVQVIQLDRFKYRIVAVVTSAGSPTQVPTVPQGAGRLPASTGVNLIGARRLFLGAGFASGADFGVGVDIDVFGRLASAGATRIGLVLNLGRLHESSFSWTVVLGGVRIARDGARFAPFGELLFGVARGSFSGSDFSFSESDRIVSVGAGVLIRTTDRLNVKVTLDEWRADGFGSIRFSIGVSIGLGSRK